MCFDDTVKKPRTFGDTEQNVYIVLEIDYLILLVFPTHCVSGIPMWSPI